MFQRPAHEQDDPNGAEQKIGQHQEDIDDFSIHAKSFVGSVPGIQCQVQREDVYTRLTQDSEISHVSV